MALAAGLISGWFWLLESGCDMGRVYNAARALSAISDWQNFRLFRSKEQRPGQPRRTAALRAAALRNSNELSSATEAPFPQHALRLGEPQSATPPWSVARAKE